jgi:hypothetical protein
VPGGEHHRCEAAVADRTDRRALKPVRVHHRAQVGRPLLERRDVIDRIRQSKAELVKHQHLTAISGLRRHLIEARVRPQQIEVPDVSEKNQSAVDPNRW